MAAQGITYQLNFDFVLEWVRLFEILKIDLPGREAPGFDVFAFHEQKTVHGFHVLRKAGLCAGNHGDDYRQDAQADEKLEMIFAYVVDEFVLPGCTAGTDENNRTVHCISVRSASTSRASFSRPCDATRM